MTFGASYIDLDEWRDHPVRHRYVHGGFEGNATRFSLYFPEAARYEGRHLTHLGGGAGGNEHGAHDELLQLAFGNGAVLVVSNQGHNNNADELGGDLSILEWRASAHSAEVAIELATAMYGTAPHHGYIFGGSGGAMRSVNCIEARPDLWQGAAPFMINRTGLMFFNWSILAWTTLVLDDKVDAVIDATSPGGSGDPYAVLDTEEQCQALAALYQAGFPHGAEPQLRPSPTYVLGRTNLDYYDDFWTTPGYEGADKHAVIARRHIKGLRAKVRKVVRFSEIDECGPADDANIENAVAVRLPPDIPVALVLDAPVEARHLVNAQFRVLSGAAEGRVFFATGARGEAITAFWFVGVLPGIEVGDEVEIDNSGFLAFAALHRHMEDLGYPETAHIAADEAVPSIPASHWPLSLPTGKFDGKIILMQHQHDIGCMPNAARPYLDDVARELGDDIDARFRIWWIDNAAHVPAATKPGTTWLINWCFAPAVRDVIRWVEDGVAPPPSTPYVFDDTNALIVPADAAERRGVQPVATASANDGERAEVLAGDVVRLAGTAEMPPSAGVIRHTEWDPYGHGEWPEQREWTSGETVARHDFALSYPEPGTYFPSFRVTSTREADDEPLYSVTNLARVRVVVSAKQ